MLPRCSFLSCSTPPHHHHSFLEESTLLSGAQKGDGGFKLLELESEKSSIGSTVYLKDTQNTACVFISRLVPFTPEIRIARV